jgi:adenylate cyclase
LLNPNFIDHRFAHVLAYAGEPARAIEMLEANMRLDPFQPLIRSGYLGHAYYLLRRYSEAVPLLRECAARAPELQIAHLWLAAAYAQSGQLAEASAEAAEVLRINPVFTMEKWKCQDVYRHSMDSEHLFEGLRKAGLPED